MCTLLALADTLGGMCRPATCSQCGKATYAGCGQHVEQVLGNVAKSERCQCATHQPMSLWQKLRGAKAGA